jgi:hypothetical protein
MRAPGAARWAALVFFLAVAAWLATPAVPWLDDAFISPHSAQSVPVGGDPRYGLPPLAGATRRRTSPADDTPGSRSRVAAGARVGRRPRPRRGRAGAVVAKPRPRRLTAAGAAGRGRHAALASPRSGAPLAGLRFRAAVWPHPPRLRFQALAIAAIAFVPWALWVYGDTGAWIPRTRAAKTALCQVFGWLAAALNVARCRDRR